MFGNDVEGPITSEIIALEHTPHVISVAMMALVTFFPIAKVPLK